jgi:hypothetical protein
MFSIPRALLTLVATLGCSIAALAADGVYTATLDGAQQLPEPVATRAAGVVELRPSADGKHIAFTVSVTNLANAAAADVHLGGAAVNGPVVLKLFPRTGAAPKQGPFTGVLAQGTISAGDFIGPMTGASIADFMAELQDSNVYTNVHSNDGVDPPNSGPGDYRLGEIRGQFQ